MAVGTEQLPDVVQAKDLLAVPSILSPPMGAFGTLVPVNLCREDGTGMPLVPGTDLSSVMVSPLFKSVLV